MQYINLYHFHHISAGWRRLEQIRFLIKTYIFLIYQSSVPPTSISSSRVRPSLSYITLSFLVSKFLFIIFHLSFSYHSILSLSSSSNSSLLHLPFLLQSLSSFPHHYIHVFEPLTGPLVPSSLWNIDQASLPTCLTLSQLPLKKRKENPNLSSSHSSSHSLFIISFHPFLALYHPINPTNLFVCLSVIFTHCFPTKPKRATWSWSSPSTTNTTTPSSVCLSIALAHYLLGNSPHGDSVAANPGHPWEEVIPFQKRREGDRDRKEMGWKRREEETESEAEEAENTFWSRWNRKKRAGEDKKIVGRGGDRKVRDRDDDLKERLKWRKYKKVNEDI